MTPGQAQTLSGAASNDLVLISNAAEWPVGPRNITRHGYQLVFVDSRRTNPGNGSESIYIKPVQRFRPRDWVLYRRHGIQDWLQHNRSSESIPIDRLLHLESHIDLRPSDDTILSKLLHYVCAYEACRDGLVLVNEHNSRVLRSFQVPSQGPNTTRGDTICPVCTGTEIYREHEHHVASYINNSTSFGTGAYIMHLQRVNQRRAQLMYPAMALSTNPIQFIPASGSVESERDWSPGTTAASETAYSTPSPAVIFHASQQIRNTPILMAASTSGPARKSGRVKPASIKPLAFYQKAVERIFENECQICQEPFAEGQMIAELPCWHFFHRECFGRCATQRCPLRCNEV